MRVRLDEFVDALRREDVTLAGAAGSDFSTIAILASGNRELQTHADLVVARTLRLLALTAASDIWEIWIRGYRETLELLERDERGAAVERYRQIYTEYRARVETSCSTSPPRPDRPGPRSGRLRCVRGEERVHDDRGGRPRGPALEPGQGLLPEARLDEARRRRVLPRGRRRRAHPRP